MTGADAAILAETIAQTPTEAAELAAVIARSKRREKAGHMPKIRDTQGRILRDPECPNDDDDVVDEEHAYQEWRQDEEADEERWDVLREMGKL